MINTLTIQKLLKLINLTNNNDGKNFAFFHNGNVCVVYTKENRNSIISITQYFYKRLQIFLPLKIIDNILYDLIFNITEELLKNSNGNIKILKINESFKINVIYDDEKKLNIRNL